MAVKIGSARQDEKGKITGGAAGDQTGKEVSTQAWYLHSKGWRVLRPVDPVIAEKIALNMERACANDKIGYDQYQRLTLHDLAKKMNWDCSKVTTQCETDCSALVRVCALFAGVPDPGNFTTSNLASKILSTGRFKELSDKKYTTQENYLCRGDILVTKTKGHTVVVLSNGKYAEVVTLEPIYGVDDLQMGDANGAVKILQQTLIELKYDCGKYGADGEFGNDTLLAVKAFQHDAGLTIDGIVGAKTYAALNKALDALTTDTDTDEIDDEPIEDGDIVVAKGSWNLRSSPSAEGSKARVVHGGDKLKSVDTAGWKPVQGDGCILWISEKGVV